MGESRLGISRPPELVKIPPIADRFRTSAKLHRRLLGNRRVPACQASFASSQCFSDLHTTIGTRWYTCARVRITHARCRTEGRKRNIIYIAEKKIAYTSGCSSRSNRWPGVGGEPAGDLSLLSATSLGSGGHSRHYDGPRTWQGGDMLGCTVR